jgi:large subunit ribosomal protein L22
MAEEKKDTGKQSKSTAKKPAARTKSAAKKTAAGSTAEKRAKKPAAKPKETATKGKAGTAASATSKTADSKASKTADSKASKASTSKAPAKKPAAKPKAESKTAAKAKAEAKPKAAPKKAKRDAGERPVVSARARFVRLAPRKARLVADQVRGLPIEDAIALLRFSSRGAARDIRKLIESAAANAEANHDLVADDLLIKDIHVDEGPTLRRYRPRALGRATRINKRTSHIAVALTPED